MRSLILPIVGLVTVSILTAGACGGSTDNAQSAGDGGTEAAPRYEAGTPDTYVPYARTTALCVPAPYADAGVVTGPGFPADDAGDDDAGPPLGPPQLTSGGGPVLTAPKLVPITYAGDDLADQIEDFVGSIGCTNYWQQATGEYGVGQAEMLTPVRLTDTAPATISDNSIRGYLAKQITAKAPGFTDPPAGVIYTLFYPSTTTVELQGSTSCSQSGASFDGYHDSFAFSGRTIAYAVIARCGGDDIDTVTSAVSHELVEATTDPNPETNQRAYLLVDNNHAAYAFLGGGEAGDLCEFNRNAVYTPSDYPFAVQRTWSNRSILAGHDPCVPAPSGPYIAAIPDEPDTISVSNYYGGNSTRGISIPIGQSRTIDIHPHSDDPSMTSWTISARDSSQFLEGTTHLTLALDTTTATVGQVVHLTITRNSQGQVYGVEPFSIRSTSGASMSTWYGVVGN